MLIKEERINVNIKKRAKVYVQFYKLVQAQFEGTFSYLRAVDSLEWLKHH